MNPTPRRTLQMLRESILIAEVAERRAQNVAERRTLPEIPAAKRPGAYKYVRTTPCSD